MTDDPFLIELIRFHVELFSLDIESALLIAIALCGLHALSWVVFRGRLVGSRRQE